MRVDHEVVRKAPLFAALDSDDAEALLAQMSPARMERGDILFREGEAGDSLYVIGEGKIKLGRSSSDGRENLVAILGPGEMFGELSLFDPGPRTMTATAVAETQLLGLGNDSLTGLLTGRPEVAKALLAALAQRLRRTNEHLADLVFTDVPGPRGQGAARSRRAVRPPGRGGRHGQPRPHPGGAGPAGRRVPRDGEQGARRLRRPRLAASWRRERCCCSTSTGCAAGLARAR